MTSTNQITGQQIIKITTSQSFLNETTSKDIKKLIKIERIAANNKKTFCLNSYEILSLNIIKTV
tara:strand:- start:450 stop:641 length:192 start_codon:yes stop_codon:yes gene_type:complete